MSEHDNNRSSALSPEQIAMINTTTASAVQSAIEGLFKGLLPALKDMAVTPEKLREANRPYEDPAKIARELRESLKSKEDEAEQQRMNRARMDACNHLDKNGRSSINLCHNQPDHQPRGVCVVCGDWIHPREWRIAASETLAKQFSVAGGELPKGKAYVVAAHKDYRTVIQLESMS